MVFLMLVGRVVARACLLACLTIKVVAASSELSSLSSSETLSTFAFLSIHHEQNLFRVVVDFI